MPSARKLLEEQGVDPTKMTGSGRDGRITKSDVLSAAQGRSPAPAAAPGAAPAPATLPAVAPPVNVDKLLAGRAVYRVPEATDLEAAPAW